MASAITVRSHVARDLLQSAALFKTDKLVVWEYVANGLQYRNPALAPVVNVTLGKGASEIVIEDNGAGMDKVGLQNFFVMHGENEDRKAGRAGRGRFGTGKSAAFGIANSFSVTSVRDGKRNSVQLTRKAISSAGDKQIPVSILENDVATIEPNGTTIRISDLNLKKLDHSGIIKYIERHLAHWPNKPLVSVNSHVCEYCEPPVAEIREIFPTPEQATILGTTKLTLKIAKSPLDTEQQGVAIHSNGVWLQSTLAGEEGQPMSQFIFGDIDVPTLDDDISPISAFDMSRSMNLNLNNPVVQTLFSFLGFEIEKIRRELVKRDRALRQQEEMKKLNREAQLIANIINSDFADFSDRLAKVKAKSGTGRDLAKSKLDGGENEKSLVNGDKTRASDDPSGDPIGDNTSGNKGRSGASSGGGGSGGGKSKSNNSSLEGSPLSSDEQGRSSGNPVDGGGQRRKQQGGFRVEFREMGESTHRASYMSSERTIYVNLDHPQIKAAKGTEQSDNVSFRRLAYEVAFTEYSVALATEMDNNGEFMEASDALFTIRETLNRMARRAAGLYQS